MRKSRINKKTVVGGIVIGDNNTIINCDQDRIEEAVERKYLELISSIFRHTQIQKIKIALISLLVKTIVNEKKRS